MSDDVDVYSSFDDWWTESEGFSIRAERFDYGPQALEWLKTAWQLGEASGRAKALAETTRKKEAEYLRRFHTEIELCLKNYLELRLQSLQAEKEKID